VHITATTNPTAQNDCSKRCYLPDLVSAEILGLVGPGTVVAADNVVYPGTVAAQSFRLCAGA